MNGGSRIIINYKFGGAWSGVHGGVAQLSFPTAVFVMVGNDSPLVGTRGLENN
jgi:hypothetical protein